MKERTRPSHTPWYARHFELLYQLVRAHHAAAPPDQVGKELAAIFAEGDRRRARRKNSPQDTPAPGGASLERKSHKSGKEWLRDVMGRPLAGVPIVLAGAGAVMSMISSGGWSDYAPR